MHVRFIFSHKKKKKIKTRRETGSYSVTIRANVTPDKIPQTSGTRASVTESARAMYAARVAVVAGRLS